MVFAGHNLIAENGTLLAQSELFSGETIFADVDIERICQERDAHRLRVMEMYCRGTGCLRNYILNYFGETTDTQCDNCGNCHRDYKEQDMTAQAKWVINCVTETRGRYGLNIVLGTLMGANRARIRELGTNNYKSYGALKEYTEDEIRDLIMLLISNRGAKQTIRNCNKVRSAILTSFLILLMMRLSCSEKFSALSNAFARIPSAILSWSTNHLMSFDTFFIILFF